MLSEVPKTTGLTVNVFVCAVHAWALSLHSQWIPDLSEHHSTSAA